MKGGVQRLHGFGRQKLPRGLVGFTIIEVMIVLAITGLLLAGAIFLVAGKQNQTEFQQAITQVTSQIQQAINDVGNGYYPNLTDFTCTNSGGVVNLQATPAGTGTSQGSNAGCVFLGKVIPFNKTDTSYNAYTLAGLRQPGTQETTGLTTGSSPTLIAQTAGSQPNAPTDDLTTQALENGLHVYSMKDSSGNPIGAMAFVSASQGTYSGGVLSSGSEQVELYSITGTSVNNPVATTIQYINTHSATYTAIYNPVSSVQVCFASGTTSQSGLVTIAYGSGELQATAVIKNGTVC